MRILLNGTAKALPTNLPAEPFFVVLSAFACFLLHPSTRVPL